MFLGVSGRCWVPSLYVTRHSLPPLYVTRHSLPSLYVIGDHSFSPLYGIDCHTASHKQLSLRLADVQLFSGGIAASFGAGR